MSLESFIKEVVELTIIAATLASVDYVINGAKYDKRREERIRAWIERVCIGGPME